MENSVIEIKCSGCDNKFKVFFKGSFDVSENYSATCPICEGDNFFDGPVVMIGTNIPAGAVTIVEAVKL